MSPPGVRAARAPPGCCRLRVERSAESGQARVVVLVGVRVHVHVHTARIVRRIHGAETRRHRRLVAGGRLVGRIRLIFVRGSRLSDRFGPALVVRDSVRAVLEGSECVAGVDEAPSRVRVDGAWSVGLCRGRLMTYSRDDSVAIGAPKWRLGDSTRDVRHGRGSATSVASQEDGEAAADAEENGGHHLRSSTTVAGPTLRVRRSDELPP